MSRQLEKVVLKEKGQTLQLSFSCRAANPYSPTNDYRYYTIKKNFREKENPEVHAKGKQVL